MKKSVFAAGLMATVLFSNSAIAAESCVIEVKVNGLVCDFCARALEKTFGKREEVQSIAVDLDAGKVRITMHDGKTLEESTLRRLITDSGYDIAAIDTEC